MVDNGDGDDGEPLNIPAPMTVAEILAQRQPGAAQPPEGFLEYDEVTLAWPAVWMLQPVIEANNVRRCEVITALTTGELRRNVFNADDVQRVQDEMAAGTARLEPAWRRDTPQGRTAIRQYERQRARRRTVTAVLVTGLILAALVLVVVLQSM